MSDDGSTHDNYSAVRAARDSSDDGTDGGTVDCDVHADVGATAVPALCAMYEHLAFGHHALSPEHYTYAKMHYALRATSRTLMLTLDKLADEHAAFLIRSMCVARRWAFQAEGQPPSYHAACCRVKSLGPRILARHASSLIAAAQPRATYATYACTIKTQRDLYYRMMECATDPAQQLLHDLARLDCSSSSLADAYQSESSINLLVHLSLIEVDSGQYDWQHEKLFMIVLGTALGHKDRTLRMEALVKMKRMFASHSRPSNSTVDEIEQSLLSSLLWAHSKALLSDIDLEVRCAMMMTLKAHVDHYSHGEYHDRLDSTR